MSNNSIGKMDRLPRSQGDTAFGNLSNRGVTLGNIAGDRHQIIVDVQTGYAGHDYAKDLGLRLMTELQKFYAEHNSHGVTEGHDSRSTSSVWTTYKNDNKATWRKFRRDLIKSGFGSDQIEKHSEELKDRLRELTLGLNLHDRSNEDLPQVQRVSFSLPGRSNEQKMDEILPIGVPEEDFGFEKAPILDFPGKEDQRFEPTAHIFENGRSVKKLKKHDDRGRSMHGRRNPNEAFLYESSRSTPDRRSQTRNSSTDSESRWSSAANCGDWGPKVAPVEVSLPWPQHQTRRKVSRKSKQSNRGFDKFNSININTSLNDSVPPLHYPMTAPLYPYDPGRSPPVSNNHTTSRPLRYTPEEYNYLNDTLPPQPFADPATNAQRYWAPVPPVYLDARSTNNIPAPPRTNEKEIWVREDRLLKWKPSKPHELHPVKECPTLPEGWDWRIDNENRLFYVDTYAQRSEKRCFWQPPKEEDFLTQHKLPGWFKVTTLFGRIFWVHQQSNIRSYEWPGRCRQILHNERGELFLRQTKFDRWQHWKKMDLTQFLLDDGKIACQISVQVWNIGISDEAVEARGDLWWGNSSVNESNLRLSFHDFPACDVVFLDSSQDGESTNDDQFSIEMETRGTDDGDIGRGDSGPNAIRHAERQIYSGNDSPLGGDGDVGSVSNYKKPYVEDVPDEEESVYDAEDEVFKDSVRLQI